MNIFSSLILLLTAFIWGSTFVAQKLGADSFQPFSFIGIRSLLGGVFLLLIMLVRKLRGRKLDHMESSNATANLFIGGICCGIALFIPSLFQQIGIKYTTPGISGFVTSIYVLLVPIFGFVVGRRFTQWLWPCIAMTLVGLYMICIDGPVRIGKGEAYTLLCAACYAVQILVAAHFVRRCDVLALSCIQLFTSAILAAPFMFLLPSEAGSLSAESISTGWKAAAYAGIMSSGIAYTLQNVGQVRTPPALASIIMSLESVFALLSGWVFLHQHEEPRQLIGCAIVFTAVISAQLVELYKGGINAKQ